MHYGCIAIIRNGISMCKYVVFHYEEFTNPVETFMLGIFIMVGNMICEITNGVSALSYTSVINIISKFVGFKILIQVQDYYLRQRQNFPVKQSVSETLYIYENRDKIFGTPASEKPDSLQADVSSTQNQYFLEVQDKKEKKEEIFEPAPLSIKLLFYSFRLINGFFNSIYFYFFPLFYLGVPFTRLIFSNQIQNTA